jgi:glycosyltransferase involved in cell wall biosynthesis
MNPPLVSFFVMTYNMAPYLSDCLKGIFNQRGNYDFEVVVVDDASTDNTEEVVRAFSDPRLTYVRHPLNQGGIATAHDGFARVRGRYVARIDGDDRHHPDFLARTIPILESDPGIGLVYGEIAMIDKEGRVNVPKAGLRREGRPSRGNEYLSLLEENFVPAPSTIARREAWLRALPIPLDLRFGDWHLTLGIGAHWDFYFVDEVLADYRIHSANMHRNMLYDRSGEKSAFQILNAHFQSPIRQAEKKPLRNRIYGAHYLIHAEKYFGVAMNQDARRCYLKAFRHCPSRLLRLDVLRRFAGTFVSRQLYERAKRLARLGSAPRPKMSRA